LKQPNPVLNDPLDQTTSPSSLDELYGASLMPVGVYAYENRRQKSWIRLDDMSGDEIQALFQSLSTRLHEAEILVGDFTVLWLINEAGALLVAIEEAVCPIDTRATLPTYPTPEELFGTYPLPRLASRLAPRLGHGAMALGAPARIGGELDFDPEDGKIYVSNKSGRYGLNRSPSQLEHATDRFKALGLDAAAAPIAYGGLS